MRVSLERAEGTRRMCRKVGMMRPAGVRARAVRRSQRPGSEGIWSLFITALPAHSTIFPLMSTLQMPGTVLRLCGIRGVALAAWLEGGEVALRDESCPRCLYYCVRHACDL